MHSRHKTHVIMIHGRLGMGWGQIAEPPNYQVLTLQEAKNFIHATFSPNEAVECCNNWFDFETHPELLMARKKNPNSIRLPVIFHFQSFLLTSPLKGVLKPDGLRREIVPHAMCDKRAREAFAELKQISFPTVTSPSYIRDHSTMLLPFSVRGVSVVSMTNSTDVMDDFKIDCDLKFK